MPTQISQTILAVPGNPTTWIDSGVLIDDFQYALTARCVGYLQYVGGPDCNGGGTAGPANGADLDEFPADTHVVNCYGLAILLLPDGMTPGDAQYATAVYGLPRTANTDTVEATFFAPVLDAGGRAPAPRWRIWLIPNDDNRENNTPLAWNVTLTVFLPDRPAAPHLSAIGLRVANSPRVRLTAY